MITLTRRWLWRVRGLFCAAPAALTLAALCLAVLLMQFAAARVEFVYGYTFGNALVSSFGLSWPLLSRGFFWQPLTYMFLHEGWWHFGLNMLTVLLFGSGLEREIGSWRFWRVFLAGGVVGGLGWLAATASLAYLPAALAAGRHTLDNSMCIGASGGVFALIGAYAALFPQREVMLLLPFPIRMRARTLALLLGILTVAEAVFLQSQVAYAAHLAGGLAGYFLGKRL
ncbi:MAG: rhomboid family intramembrane serine protease [Kiritimatiellae bacterium]|nr:rhomboid family intramembrane serine protease [Kiritimatiellia bacterium]MDD4025132.1 rhomboid family intramembrane serine protease [Kiritimatiellia bacterium]